MAQEEHIQKYSNSSSGGGGGGGCGEGGCCSRSYKRMKQKKVPQRGLGVAQLEKIRLEEQQKKEAALQAANILTTNPIISHSNSTSCLAVQCPTFRPSVSSSTSVPLLPPSATDHLPSLNSMLRPSPSIPNLEILHPPMSKPLNVSSGGERGWSAAVPTPVTVPGHGTWPRVWNGDYNLEGENHRLDHHGFRCRPNANIAHDSTPSFVPRPNLKQRSPQLQPPSPSSLVNISTGISASPVMNFHTEPPSNQNIPGSNNYSPLWPDEEKMMIGMKRPYPFSVETPPAPSFSFPYPLTFAAPTSRLDEAVSCNNRGPAAIRECPVRPNTMSEPAKLGHTDTVRERGRVLDGDFLSLAPPTDFLSLQLSSKHKQSLPNSGLQSCELSEYHHAHPCRQGSTDDAIQGQCSSKPTLFNFFPSPNDQQQQQKIGHSSTTLANNCSNNGLSSSTDVGGENIDLSLKL